MGEAETSVILAIGIEDADLEALCAALPANAELKLAHNAVVGAALLRSSPPPSLVVQRYDEHALEACRQFHRDPVGRAIPQLLLCDRLAAEDEQRALEAGASDFLPRPLDRRLTGNRLRQYLGLGRREAEIEQRVRERTRDLVEAKQSLELERRDREKAIARADYLANYDPLTSLPNRRHLLERAETEYLRVRQDRGTMALLLLNIDRFHVVNNALGSANGDRLLIACAERLEPCLRRHDVFGRLGADEFMVLLLGEGLDWHERAAQVERVGQRMLEVLRAPFEIEGHRIELSASAGYAMYPGDGEGSAELYRCAAAALRHAKSERRGSIEGYRPPFDVRAAEQFRHEEILRNALGGHRLQLHFQPKVSLQDGRMTGAEALLRLPLSEQLCMGAGELIALAQEANLLDAVEDQVLQLVFRQVATWSSRLPTDFRIAFNLSPARFRQRDLPQQLQQLARATGAPPRQLEVEITEGALIDDIDAAVERLRAIRMLGFAISLDDFGTGYSSLSYLKLLPLDTLKIDQHFVRDIARDPRDAAIVRAIVDLAGSMGLVTVAEGVETEEQLASVRAQQCRHAQGYLFSRPVPAQTFEELLTHRSTDERLFGT